MMSLEIALERIRLAKENKHPVLDLSDLGLEEIPEEVGELTELTHLFLEKNRIREIEVLASLKKLKVLALNDNLIAEIPSFLLDLEVSFFWQEVQETRSLTVIKKLDLKLDADLGQVLNQVRVRALGLDLALTRALDHALSQVRNLARNLDIARVLDIARDLDINLALGRARESARARARALDLNIDQNLPPDQVLDLNLARARVLGRALVQAQDLELALSVARDLALALARDRARDLNLSLDLDLTLDLALVRALKLALPSDLDLDLALVQAVALARDLDINLAQDLDLNLARTLDLNLDQALALDRTINILISLCSILNLASILLYVELYYSRLNINLKVLLAIGKWIQPAILLKNNPLVAPPPEIAQKGDAEIRIFLQDFTEKLHLNEVKVILVGEGASGKTSLVKQLVKQNFDKKESQTHGIKISKHPFKYQDQNLIVHFWDFGGQEIMHATHQFFLTKRCLYLLVLDSRKDEKAEYWLNYIKSFGGDAPVLVVLNKIDENPSFEVNRQFLNKKYGNILGYHRVSCAKNHGIDELRNELLDQLWNLELRNTAFPKGWLNVKTQMEKMKEDYISYTEYQAISNQNFVVNAQSQKVLLELLNDLGVVLNYENLRYYDTQVLNPLWLTNAVYRIINSPILAQSLGRFNINDLDAIINDPRYQKENPEHWSNVFKFWTPEQKMLKFPEEKFLFIVAMMKQFELLFQLDDQHYLIPGLLPDEENTLPFEAKDAVLQFVIEFQDFLPTAIIPRLMVKLHKYIYKEQRWKTGMVLEEKLLFHSIANIVLDKESKKINIEIKGQRSRDFLTVIRETIREINATYQDIEVTEWVPLPDLYKGEQLLVDYQELLGHEEGGQKNYYSGKLKKSYVVADLLNGIEKPEMRQSWPTYHVFVSYAEEDIAHKETLLKHLTPLIRLNKAKIWDDSCIIPGEVWDTEVYENLEKADIVLCLISSHFIASEFCYSDALVKALKAHEQGHKKVIPIKIKEVNWDQLPIAQLQALPRTNWMKDIKDDSSWTEISKGVEEVLENLKQKALR